MKDVLFMPYRRHPAALMMFAVALLAGCGGVSPVVAAEAKVAGSWKIPVWTFDRGNAKIVANPDIYADYRDKHPELVAVAGDQLPWVLEYDVEFPVDATYTLHIRYGSPDERPMEVWLDGRKIGTCCGRVTGNAPPYPDRHPVHNRPREAVNFHGVEWEEACVLPVTTGKHTLKFTRQGQPPRVSALRLDSPVAFPKDWKQAERPVKLDSITPTLRRNFLPPSSVIVETLRMALEDVIAEYGARYPKGPEYLKQLADLDQKQKAAQNGTPEQKLVIETQLQALQREVMLAHPLLKIDQLLLVKRKSWGSSHIYNNYGPGSDATSQICVLSPVAPDGKVTAVAPQLKGGLFGQFNLSFDAKKLVFAYSKDEKTNSRIYEIGVDGKDLRQLTFDGDQAAELERYNHVSYGNYIDMDPCYLPDGKIMFVSTRSGRAVSCHPSIVTSLHVMDADGGNMRCISGGQFTELDPYVLDDGRVIYMRWEYIDKGFGNGQSLWSVRPDGSYADHVYKNNLLLPAAMIGARGIPDSKRFVTIAAAHGGAPIGPVVLVDNRQARHNADEMTNITPEIAYPGMGQITHGKGTFRQPCALSEKLFLVSHDPQIEKQSRSCIYVLDAWGNRTELYGDPDTSCFQPVPLRPRATPTRIASLAGQYAAEEAKTATMFIQDIYQGMTGIERGRVKYVRVMEAMPTTWEDVRSGFGDGMQAAAVSMGADHAIKKIHGIAPVHDDGSALFTVPPNKNIFFQALDENYMELQRMRTFMNFMPGEKRSCIGCHEPRRITPGLRPGMAVAMSQPVHAICPQPGDSGPRTVHYETDIQPLFDKHCISCHGGQQPKADLDLTRELTEKFSRSYETILKKQLVSFLHGGFGSANIMAEPPLTFGSHQSKLVTQILKDPCKAGLTREEFIRIVTWIDANVPYYGTHQGKKDRTVAGRIEGK
jgi:hypothetical protein